MRNLLKHIIVFLAVSVLAIPQLSAQSDYTDSLHDFQLSLFPGLGTDGGSTFENRYRISLNLFMGANSGIEGMELGAFMNINKGAVNGLQLAGFGNFVNGASTGLQGAGFMNVNKSHSTGIHLAGFMNVMRGNHDGLLGAGFMNVVNGDSRSLAWAGFMNVTKGNTQGIEAAGFMNVSGGNSDGIKAAGFMNVTKGESSGIFTSGFANVSGSNMMGIQTAGFMNIARDMNGIQVAGFLNVARRAEGIQVGFLNISDTITGIPVGFLSIVKRGGLKQIEIAASDAMFMNASLKLGVPVFYNIFSAGFRPHNDVSYVSLGYGLGTRINLGYPSFIHIEAHGSALTPDMDNHTDANNILSELRTTYNFNLNTKIQLFAGVTLYNHIYQPTDRLSYDDLEIAPWTIAEDYYKEWKSQWWIGGRAGLVYIIN